MSVGDPIFSDQVHNINGQQYTQVKCPPLTKVSVKGANALT